jgi:hypothetical protein
MANRLTLTLRLLCWRCWARLCPCCWRGSFPAADSMQLQLKQVQTHARRCMSCGETVFNHALVRNLLAAYMWAANDQVSLQAQLVSGFSASTAGWFHAHGCHGAGQMLLAASPQGTIGTVSTSICLTACAQAHFARCAWGPFQHCTTWQPGSMRDQSL